MTTLGLKKNTVKLYSHKKAWGKEFEKIKQQMVNLIGDHIIDVQHVGSTSIHGIKAKPILDIVICVKNWKKFAIIITVLEENGYIYSGDGKRNGGRLFIKEESPLIRTMHIHFLKYDDQQWENYQFFRDYLNSNLILARKYEKLKINLCKKFKNNRKMYTLQKHEFIQFVLNKKSAQQGDAPEPATNADPALPSSQSPSR